MKLTLFFDHRFFRDPSGVAYSPASYNYELLASRYLSVFSQLTVVARVIESHPGDRGEKQAEGDGVRLVSVGDWQGPRQYLGKRQHVKRIVGEELEQAEAVLMIAPGTIGQVAASQLRKSSRPYGVEVVGDPMDVFAAGAMRHPLRPVLRAWAVRELRQETAAAASVAYVSTTNLPQRYPAPAAAFVTNYSSIELKRDHFVREARPSPPGQGELRLITIGTLSQMYKGIDVLIDALAILAAKGLNVSLTVLGDGRFRKDLEAQARARGVANHMRFLGHLPAGDAIRAHLDDADIFVLASRTEGLPRAMIEAMARGLPCIGTSVGGVPELLVPEDMVPAGDAQALARKIEEVWTDRDRMTSMSSRNLANSRSYSAEILMERRRAMYGALKEATERWRNPT